MVVGEAQINNIMGGIENTGSVRLHNHKRKLKQRFDIIKKLGQGTYGKVQLGINKETGQEVAIKTIKKSKIETEADLIRIRREIQIMSSVQHPNIIHIYEVFENREKMVLVMEYAAGGELYDYLSERKILVEEEARRIFRQISTACYYCHKHKICHRDLKLENILLDENRNAKIADFGLSNVFDDQRLLSTFCGSPLYASPEIVKGTPYHGPEVDCWSLGVLLYTLVYGAMPFDGSNFKRLVKQISQGDYFEPKQPSPASPLILEMLTVNPKNRANIEKICAHWWVNETYDESCLEISEDLANQTPVRLDLLLSLNPPPQLEGDKLVVTGGEIPEEQAEPIVPCTRSQSVGSLMDVSNPAERRIKDLIAQELKATPKRKLETTVSTDQVNIADVKRKDKIVKENTIADISVHSNNLIKEENENNVDIKMTDVSPQKIDIDNVKKEDIIDVSLQGAACSEILEEEKQNETKKQIKVKKTLSSNLNSKILEEINENPSQENLYNDKNKENTIAVKEEEPKTELIIKEETKAPVKKKIIKKKVLGDKNEIAKPKKEKSVEKSVDKPSEEKPDDCKSEEICSEPPSKPMERRQSRIFEQAEKFQNLITSSDSKAQVSEKPKKIVIPGVSVGGFKQDFERKASLTNTSPPKLRNTTSKKLIIEDKSNSIDIKDKVESPKNEIADEPKLKQEAIKIEPKLSSPPPKEVNTPSKDTSVPPISAVVPLTPPVSTIPVDDDRKLKLKNAVSIISSALDKEGTRKSKSRPCMGRKPPVPFGMSGRSASGSIGLLTSPPNDGKRFLKMQMSVPADNRVSFQPSSTPEQVSYQPEVVPEESQTSSAEITLKSATLPRRKTAKAEIQLDYPKTNPGGMEFKTEMAHNVQASPKLTTQRSEVIVPVNPPQHTIGFRSSSVDAETKAPVKERIIPIAFERPITDDRETIQSPPMKPPVPRFFQSQKSNTSQRSNSLSRQSTQESDTETSASGDPIRKSPREYIIPIAVEGGGYVTPRAGSLEPSDTSSTITNSSRKASSSKFGRPRRMMSFLDRDGSEDESPFTSLHRHSSFGKDSDTEGDSKKDAFHMHRLRSSRPRKSTLEHTDSVSSEEDNDDDDGFEFLTAENLFSTLLSRVRDLTTRLNVDDGNKPGFPNSRLLSHFDHGTNFWNRMEPLGSTRNTPLGRQFSRERSMNSSSSIPWRRSVSRDLASDIETVFNDPNRTTPTKTSSLPRGEKTNENLNLADLNLKKLKLTEEDALALSYLTPGLSRRIQKQLFASLPPAEAKKITRTLSMRDETPKESTPLQSQRRSVDRISSTLPRKFSFDRQKSSIKDSWDINQNNNTSINENEAIDHKTNITERMKSTFTSNKEPTVRDISSYGSSSSKTNISSRDSSVNRDTITSNSRDTSRDLTSPLSDRSCRSESFDSRKSDIRPRNRYLRASSLREPNDFKSSLRTSSLRSPDSSISEIAPLIDDDTYLCGPENTSLSKFLHQSKKYCDTSEAKITKSDVKPVRKISRFLRPDFFDSPKEESVVVKEKKEREMETQKVLKEIRDKRIRNRISMRRERSLSRERSLEMLKGIKTDVLGQEKCVRNITETSQGVSKDNSYENLNGERRNVVETQKDDIIKNIRERNEASKLKNMVPSVYSNKVSNNETLYDTNKELEIIKCKDLVQALTELNHSSDILVNDEYTEKGPTKITDTLNNNDVTQNLLKNVSDNIKNIESNVLTSPITKKSEVSIDKVVVKKGISKLMRPKSYPAENGAKPGIKETTTKELPAVKEVLKITELPKLKSKENLQIKEELAKTKENAETEETQLKFQTKEPSAKISDVKSKEINAKQQLSSTNTKSKISKLRKGLTPQKSKDSKKEPSADKPKNKFLQSIEKKFEKLRTFNASDSTEEKKIKEEKKSTVEHAIKKLREHSVPRTVDNITESTLIKRAASVEDFSNVKNKTLQPSRKSVTKILSLFKKYEDKKEEEPSQLKNGADNAVMLHNINESNIPLVKQERVKSPDSSQSDDSQRPKSLLFDTFKRYNGSRSDDTLTLDSKKKNVKKIPVNSLIRRSLHMETNALETNKNHTEDDLNPNSSDLNKSSSETKTTSNIDRDGSEINDFEAPKKITHPDTKLDRNHLKLDFANMDTRKDHSPSLDVNLNRNCYNTDESSTLLSPNDDLSNDSWSVCSDFHHTQDLQSPLSPNGNHYNSGDENESVIDRIRRKSFYTRFNEKKKPRKSLVGNYRDLDLYKDLNQKSARYKSPDLTNSNSVYRKSYNSSDGEHEYRPYARSKSLMNDYVNVPNSYQTYNPRRSNIQSLYSSMNEDSEEADGGVTGTYKKYSYNPKTSRLGSRSSRSPSSDFQLTSNVPSTSETTNSTTDNINRPLPTEHAV